MKKLIIFIFALLYFQSFSQSIENLPNTITYESTDLFIIDQTDATKNIKALDLFGDVTVYDTLEVEGESLLKDTVRITKPMYISGNLFNGTGIGSAAAGSPGWVQFNTSSIFDAEINFYWDKSSNFLRIKNAHIKDTLKIINNSETDTSLIYLDSEALNIQSDYVKISDSLEVNKSITLGENPGENHKAGKLYYDTTEQALTFFNNQKDFTWQISREIPVRFYNNTGSTIPNGTLVRSTGSKVNGSISFTADLAGNSSLDSLQGIAMATIDVLDGEYGEATLVGQVNGLNTSMFSDNDLLWVGHAGGYTNLSPEPPLWSTIFGRVAYADEDSGAIYIFPIGETAYRPLPSANATFNRETVTINNPGQNVFAQITNATNDIYTINYSKGFTSAGDSVRVLQSGTYNIVCNYAFQGDAIQGDDWRVGIFVNGVEVYSVLRTSSASNKGVVALGRILTLTTDDWITTKIANTTNATRDAIFTDGSVSAEFISLQ